MSNLEKAILFATKGHMNQKDKAGMPYILHPLKMMLKMDSEEEMITAVLHDLIEDTNYTIKDLRDAGFSANVLQAVDCLSHKEGISYDDYINRIKGNPISRKVKIADFEDNMDIRRIGDMNKIDSEKLKKYRWFWGELRKAEELSKKINKNVGVTSFKVSIDSERSEERAWVYTDSFSLVREKGVWKESIPSAYELMDYYGPLEDPVKATAIIQDAMIALKLNPSLFFEK